MAQENKNLTKVPSELISPENSLAHVTIAGEGPNPPSNDLGNNGDIYIQTDELDNN